MRRSLLAALAFTIVLGVPALAGARPKLPPTFPHAIRPADGPGANVVPREHLRPSRAMDLVGWVDVRGELTGRAQAVEQLRRKALAMGADGIANVEFHPGSAGAPSHYTASAVVLRKRHAAHATVTPAPAAPPAAQAHAPAPPRPASH
jgi:hypothetical protein